MKYNLSDNYEIFLDLMEELENTLQTKEQKELLQKIMDKNAELINRCMIVLEDSNENDYINIDEFKNFISTKYSGNFDAFYDMIENYKNYWENEKPWEKIDY